MEFKKLIHGCLDRIEEEPGWEKIPTFLLLDDWYPFRYSAIIFDYRNIVEENLYNSNCKFKFDDIRFELAVNRDYVIKIIRFSKFDLFNITNIALIVNDSIADVKRYGGDEYLQLASEVLSDSSFALNEEEA